MEVACGLGIPKPALQVGVNQVYVQWKSKNEVPRRWKNEGIIKARLHRQFLSQQLNAIFCRAEVATSKSHV